MTRIDLGHRIGHNGSMQNWRGSVLAIAAYLVPTDDDDVNVGVVDDTYHDFDEYDDDDNDNEDNNSDDEDANENSDVNLFTSHGFTHWQISHPLSSLAHPNGHIILHVTGLQPLGSQVSMHSDRDVNLLPLPRQPV